MEDWEVDFEWLKLRHFVKDSFEKTELPDVKALLFLVGIQESGIVKEEFTKEEKQDLMHVAVCELLVSDGYYKFEGRDQDGWPHYKKNKALVKMDIDGQEALLKKNLIKYFKDRNDI